LHWKYFICPCVHNSHEDNFDLIDLKLDNYVVLLNKSMDSVKDNSNFDKAADPMSSLSTFKNVKQNIFFKIKGFPAHVIAFKANAHQNNNAVGKYVV